MHGRRVTPVERYIGSVETQNAIRVRNVVAAPVVSGAGVQQDVDLLEDAIAIERTQTTIACHITDNHRVQVPVVQEAAVEGGHDAEDPLSVQRAVGRVPGGISQVRDHLHRVVAAEADPTTDAVALLQSADPGQTVVVLSEPNEEARRETVEGEYALIAFSEHNSWLALGSRQGSVMVLDADRAGRKAGVHAVPAVDSVLRTRL